MARRVTKTTASKADSAQDVFEITNDTMVSCRNGTAGNINLQVFIEPRIHG